MSLKLDPESIKFVPLFSETQISTRVKELGAEISQHYKGEPLIVVSVLKGAFIFTSDLVRAINLPVTIDFIGVASYQGTKSTGTVRITHDLAADIRGKNVLVVEDIVDTGRTLDYLLRMLAQRGPKSLKLCALLNKPAAREVPLDVDYHGFEVANQFVIGYGLDLDQRWRELPYIAQVQSS
jgi:hypoxanthine phosphoribosyltransferase